jgi:Kdo2-lipid IVA lauroyltransferase/acyltransferase
LLRVLIRLLAKLPVSTQARLGSAIGQALYYLAARRRHIAQTNLRLCGFTDPTLAKAHFAAYGRALLEHAFLWHAPMAAVRDYVQLSGEDNWRQHVGTRPIIWLCPHFVGLDAVGIRITCDDLGASMYSRQTNATLDALVRQGRERFGKARLFSRQDGVRPILRALKEQVPFFYLPDMDFGARDAVFAPFFGVSAATITGVARLAKLSKAVVVPVIARQTATGYIGEFLPAWEDFPSGDDVLDATRVNQFIESQIVTQPEQYLWTHRRFKTRPEGEPSLYN